MHVNSGNLSFISGWLKWLNPPETNEKMLFCMAHSGVFIISTNERQTEIKLQIQISDIKTVKQNRSYENYEHNDQEDNIYEFTVFLENEFYIFGCKSSANAKKWIVVLTPNKSIQNNNNNLKMTQLSDFSIICKIGSGYSGEVLLAKHKGTNKHYALKSIPIENITESKITRAISERNILMEASHPFITRLVSTFQTDKRLYLVLEYAQGGDLLYHINNGRLFSAHDRVIYLAELATALSYLHKLGIVFRDLKPSNILIGKDGHLKLTDFGLSCYLVDTSCCFSFCGTNEYLAPEIIQGDGYGFEVDWWAFGVLAFLLYEGVLPFRSLNLTKLFNQITSGKIKFFTKLDEVTTDFISRLLNKDPKKRLGAGPSGDKEIFNHPFFEGIVWKDVYDKKYSTDFRPYISNREGCNAGALFKVNEEKKAFSSQFKDFSFTDNNETCLF